MREVVAERFEREAPHPGPLATVRYDTSYREQPFVHWDGYVDVGGNRYSVPDHLGQTALSVERLDLPVYEEVTQCS